MKFCSLSQTTLAFPLGKFFMKQNDREKGNCRAVGRSETLGGRIKRQKIWRLAPQIFGRSANPRRLKEAGRHP